jgi:hypothetical protein
MTSSAALPVIETEGYKGPDRRAPRPMRAYDRTILNSEARLPPIGDLSRGIVALVVNNLEPKEVAALAMHLTHSCRESSITRSREVAQDGMITKGDFVRLVNVSTVSSKREGLVGVVMQTSNVRCYVKVKSYARPFYVYMAEVEKLSEAQYREEAGLPPNEESRRTSAKKTASKPSKAVPKKASPKKVTKKASPKKPSTKIAAEGSQTSNGSDNQAA